MTGRICGQPVFPSSKKFIDIFCKNNSCIPDMQGDFLNDLCVLNTGSNTWTATSVVGELPEARSDTQVTIWSTLSCMFLNVVISP